MRKLCCKSTGHRRKMHSISPAPRRQWTWRDGAASPHKWSQRHPQSIASAALTAAAAARLRLGNRAHRISVTSEKQAGIDSQLLTEAIQQLPAGQEDRGGGTGAVGQGLVPGASPGAWIPPALPASSLWLLSPARCSGGGCRGDAGMVCGARVPPDGQPASAPAAAAPG